jgi:energy-coupling factor transporter transmembrane protein EcfT
MRSPKQILRFARDPRHLLCFLSLLLFFIVLQDCHFCLYLRSPWGVASLLIFASSLMWLNWLSRVLGMVVSVLTFCLAVFNVLKEREYARADYGPEDWIQPAFSMSWGYLLVMLLSAVIVWYDAASLRRKGFMKTAR